MQIIRKIFIPIVKDTLYWASMILAATGVIFVALRIHESSEKIDFSRFSADTWILAISLSLLYGVTNYMPALAWRHLLGFFSFNTSRMWAIRTYGISQLARYVPGNIFHIAGRQVIGIVAGIPGVILAKSMFWELVLISMTAILFGLITIPLLLPSIRMELMLLVFIVVSALLIFSLWHLVGSLVARAAVWYIIFLAVTGLVFVGLFTIIVPFSYSTSLLVSLCGAYVIAWLIGLITPGAPAGMGVRELVLLLLLDGSVAEVDLLLVIVLGRIVTMGGDVLFYMASVISPKFELTT